MTDDSMTDDSVTDDSVNLDQMLDLATPWCLMVAATLHIPDLIADGHHDIADLATAAGCDRDALHAVLGQLVSKGVFQESTPGRFDRNRAVDQLQDRFLDLEGIGGRMAHTWGTLLDYVRTGRPAYHKVFGRPFWEDLAAHPKIAADFDALMGPAGHGMPDFDIELTGGWDGIRTMVDVGAAPAPCSPRCCGAARTCEASWSTSPARSPGPARSWPAPG
jgi:2,7-dihydroxy-5-methyl-1-naphthoate 7-O-methyltransferase